MTENSHSPCNGTCRIDQISGHCIGCARTIGEIMVWRDASPAVRARIWSDLASRRLLINRETNDDSPATDDSSAQL